MTNKEVINFLNQVRKILLDDKSWLESTIQPINEAFDMAINALTAQTEERTNERAETHGVCLDAISRQAAIDAFGLSEKTRKYGGDHSGYDTMMLYEIQDTLESLPSAQPDISEYSDKLWRNAYERGKRDAQPETIRCKDCKYWNPYYAECEGIGNWFGFEGAWSENGYCYKAERREE